MFAGKTLINKICKAHDRTLELVYDDFEKLYDELLELNVLSQFVINFAFCNKIVAICNNCRVL